ncbi:hypothetical protein C8J57DRAFT_1239462 [Mycena rebaudengoi]|nr:hypothetical protein C8J57DRAFT_1239462 [Mycena rebaudengoi]
MQFPTLAKLALILAAFTLSAQASPAPVIPCCGIINGLIWGRGVFPIMGYFFSMARQYMLRNGRVTDKVKEIFANGQLDIIGVVPSISSNRSRIDINFDRPDSELDSIALAFMDRVFFLPPMAVVASVLVLAMSKDAQEIGGTVII